MTEAAARGCPEVILYASKEGASLYRTLGFTEMTNAMTLGVNDPAEIDLPA